MKKPTLEEIKEIVTLTRNLEGGLEVFNIKGDVLGNIEGDVKGDVYEDSDGYNNRWSKNIPNSMYNHV